MIPCGFWAVVADGFDECSVEQVILECCFVNKTVPTVPVGVEQVSLDTLFSSGV